MKVLFKKKKPTEIQKVLNLNLIKRDLKISPYFQEVCICHMQNVAGAGLSQPKHWVPTKRI